MISLLHLADSARLLQESSQKLIRLIERFSLASNANKQTKQFVTLSASYNRWELRSTDLRSPLHFQAQYKWAESWPLSVSSVAKWYSDPCSPFWLSIQNKFPCKISLPGGLDLRNRIWLIHAFAASFARHLYSRKRSEPLSTVYYWYEGQKGRVERRLLRNADDRRGRSLPPRQFMTFIIKLKTWLQYDFDPNCHKCSRADFVAMMWYLAGFSLPRTWRRTTVLILMHVFINTQSTVEWIKSQWTWLVKLRE